MKNKALSITTGVLILLLSAAFFIYVIPNGNSIKIFETKFSEFVKSLKKTDENLNYTNSLDLFNNSLNKLPGFENNLDNLISEYSGIKERENFIINIWKKTTVLENDLISASEIVHKIYSGLPKNVSRIIKVSTEQQNKLLTKSTSLNNINNILLKSKNNYQNLFSNLNKIDRTDGFKNSSISFNNIKTDQGLISDMADISVDKIESLRKKEYKDVISALQNVKTVKDASEIINEYISWLKTSKLMLNISIAFGANIEKCKKVNRNIETDNKQMKTNTVLLSNIIKAEEKSNILFKNSIVYMDEANSRLQNMEKFAKASDIKSVYNSWVTAETKVENAKYALKYRGINSYKKTIWNNITSQPKENIDKVLSDVGNHINFVYQKYQEAMREEATFAGKTTRTVKRGFDRLKKGWSKIKTFAKIQAHQAANSRIGREISISTKMLVLGTKAFYDLQDPKTDAFTWAMSYQGDVEKLMKETEEVNKMRGPSITGKNTIIESFINSSYRRAFNK